MNANIYNYYKCLSPFFVYTYLKAKLKMQFTPNKYFYYAAAMYTSYSSQNISQSYIDVGTNSTLSNMYI